MEEVPKSHPRHVSLTTRNSIVAGVEAGITSIHGLIAQGRGEAFDYLIGEQTHDFALQAIEAAAAHLLLAQLPVLSINGNVAALAPREVKLLADKIGAKVEVNIFHTSKEREQKMEQALKAVGIERVLLPQDDCVLEGIDHNRRRVNPEGILRADVIFVPLEDGDRCELLRSLGKTVITVDLNPKSRTAETANVTIVDNVMRVWSPLMVAIDRLQSKPRSDWESLIRDYDNFSVLHAARRRIVENF